MIKSLVSVLIVVCIIIIGAIYENNFVKRQFSEFEQVLEVLYEKVTDESAVEDDVYAVQKNWLDKKRFLHIFIPHTEIKEVDLWLAESIKLVKNKKWEDALSKIEVLKELAEQIPMGFKVKLENVM